MKLKKTDLKVAGSPEEAVWTTTLENMEKALVVSKIQMELDEAMIKIAKAKVKAFGGK